MYTKICNKKIAYIHIFNVSTYELEKFHWLPFECLDCENYFDIYHRIFNNVTVEDS